MSDVGIALIGAGRMGAALASRLIQQGHHDAEVLVPILFVLILSTVTLHGLTIRPLAAKLGLGARASRGLLIVGAERWSLAMAERLRDAGAEVIFVDRMFRRVSRARQAGFDAYYGDVLSEETLEHVPVERLKLALAATDDEPYNALVCVAIAPTFGREQTLSVSRSEGQEVEAHLQGKMPWGEQGTYSKFAGRFYSGKAFRSTRITDEYPLKRFREDNPMAQLLFEVRERTILPLEDDDTPAVGSRVVYMEG